MATSIIAFAIGLSVAPTASADPAEPDAETPVQGPPLVYSSAASTGDTSPEAVTACSHFAGGLDVAASWYSDFANNIAGDEPPNYNDPIVNDSNTMGRTALRQSAATALEASSVPGLQPEVSGPMQEWSLNASKLLLLMAVRSPVDVINGAATDLNNNTTRVQMACAAAGTHA